MFLCGADIKISQPHSYDQQLQGSLIFNIFTLIYFHKVLTDMYVSINFYWLQCCFYIKSTFR